MGSVINRRRFLEAVGVTGALGLAGCASTNSSTDNSGNSSDSWTPDRNVTVIVPFAAGGGTDTAMRSLMKPAGNILSERGVNVSINIQNVTGASGLNGANQALSQPADGHTLFANTNVIGTLIAKGTANFTLDDWKGICRVQHDTSWLFTSGRQGNGHTTVDSLVQAARNGGIELGVTGDITSAVFLAQFVQAAGIVDQTRLVSYDDAGRMNTDVVSGELDAAFGEIQELQQQVKAGDISLLLVGTKESLKEFPNVPTAGEKGWDATWGVSRGINVRSGTPQGAIDFWMNLCHEAYQSDAYQQFEQQTLLYLREGWRPGKKWMAVVEDNIDQFETTLDTFRKSQ